MVTVMGFQVRKRTKGKSGWVNFSYSEKNGLGISVSAKAGPFTWNSGNGKSTRRRLTTDLGNGIRHVSYAKKGRSNSKTSPQEFAPSTRPWNDSDTKWAIGSLIVIVIMSAVFGLGGFFLAVIASFLWMFIKVNWYE